MELLVLQPPPQNRPAPALGHLLPTPSFPVLLPSHRDLVLPTLPLPPWQPLRRNGSWVRWWGRLWGHSPGCFCL